MSYYDKYLKYKSKYKNLKNKNIELIGGSKKKKYAIINLLMMGDSYLIGCLSLAQSIKQFKRSRKIDLICMVTPDISNEAIQELNKYYDRVVPVDYIEVDKNKIKHFQEKVKEIYAKTFTKINCLKFTEYKKILMMDVDMLVINKSFFKIFKVNTPASPFIGCLVFYKPELLDIYKKIYSELKHGSLVPEKYYDIDCQELYKEYNIIKMAPIGIESTICLLEPSLKDFNELKSILQKSYKSYKGDATLIAEYYKYKFHHIDMNYVGRWVNPENYPDIIAIDMYGFEGKPWQIQYIDKLIKYDDAKYWMKKFVEFYETTFRDKCLVKEVHELYDYLIKKLK